MLRRLALLLLLAGPLGAQEQVSPEVFLEAVVGQTLTFRAWQSDLLVGEEQFLRRDLSVWTDPTGRCTYGRLEIRGPRLCFHYEDDPDPDNCWQIFRHEGEFLVMARSLEVQRVSALREAPLSCDGVPVG